MQKDEKRILAVDDDDAIRALLLTILGRRGFTVDTARNGAEALERLGQCSYVLILLDLMMPIASGYEVLDYLAKQDAGARPMVIVLTAVTEARLQSRSGRGNRPQAFRRGAAARHGSRMYRRDFGPEAASLTSPRRAQLLT